MSDCFAESHPWRSVVVNECVVRQEHTVHSVTSRSRSLVRSSGFPVRKSVIRADE